MFFTYPISSQEEFNSATQIAFESLGAELVAGTVSAPTTVTGSAATTSNDGVRVYLMNSASAQTLTVAKDMDKVAVGSTIKVIALGAGAVTVAAASGVTIHSLNNLVSNGQYSVVEVTKVDTNTYIVSGDTTSAV
jgi:hypothetical protein